MTKALLRDARQQVIDEGVVQLPSEQLAWPVDVHALARSMPLLMQFGWPATFLLMFDEVWSLIHHASALMAATTGNACNYDVLAWYVDPNEGAAGFSPHRDRQPDDSPATFRADGSAMYSTCWVALTDACPENSCLYVVPRWADPGYFQGDDDDGPDPLSVALRGKEDFQAIRALPAAAGSAVVFTHRTIHWGSRGRKGYHTPRLAVSWGCADDAYEPPYISREHLPYPPLELRAALACGQLIVYHERFPMTKHQLSLYYKTFRAAAHSFHKSYRDKVAFEFIGASKEALVEEGGVPRPLSGGGMPGSMAGGSKTDKDNKAKKKKKMQSPEAGAAAAAAAALTAAAGGANGTAAAQGAKRKKKEEKGEAGKPTAAAAAADGAAATVAKKAKKRAAGAGAVAEPLPQPQQPLRAAKADAGRGSGVAAGKKQKKEAQPPQPQQQQQQQQQAAPPTKGSPLLGRPLKLESKARAPAAAPAAGHPGRGSDGSDDGGDGSEDEEEDGGGWVPLLGARGGGGGGAGSEDLEEDLLDAMLDAQMAGKGDDLQDDYDD